MGRDPSTNAQKKGAAPGEQQAAEGAELPLAEHHPLPDKDHGKQEVWAGEGQGRQLTGSTSRKQRRGHQAAPKYLMAHQGP